MTKVTKKNIKIKFKKVMEVIAYALTLGILVYFTLKITGCTLHDRLDIKVDCPDCQEE